MEWQMKDEGWLVKSEAEKLVDKVTRIVFWDMKGVMYIKERTW